MELSSNGVSHSGAEITGAVQAAVERVAAAAAHLQPGQLPALLQGASPQELTIRLANIYATFMTQGASLTLCRNIGKSRWAVMYFVNTMTEGLVTGCE